MNSSAFHQRFPVAGEDIKVMAVRHEKRLHLTIAVAMVDRYLTTESSYFEQKESIREDLTALVRSKIKHIHDVSIDINTLDDPERGQAGMYLTVIGTSAESGDGGEVGRGNAVNGLISLCRPTSNEAAAGKNTTCHVGNIYNHLSHRIAQAVFDSVEAVNESYVWLCSQIGRPIDQPWSASISVALAAGVHPDDVRDQVQAIMTQHLQQASTSGFI